MRARLRRLLLLLPVDDVARGEHPGVARDLEELVHAHRALGGDDVVAERGDEARGRDGARRDGGAHDLGQGRAARRAADGVVGRAGPGRGVEAGRGVGCDGVEKVIDVMRGVWCVA